MNKHGPVCRRKPSIGFYKLLYQTHCFTQYSTLEIVSYYMHTNECEEYPAKFQNIYTGRL